MIELKDISFREYFEISDKSEYDFAINYSKIYNKSVNHYNIDNFRELSFGLIKDIQYDLQEGMSWENFFDYSKKIIGYEISNQKLLKICQWKSYLIEQINDITYVESIALSYTPTDKEIMAGIDELNELGIYLQIRKLTGGDITKNEAVMNCKYEDAFVELVAQKKLFEYEKQIIEIRKSKN